MTTPDAIAMAVAEAVSTAIVADRKAGLIVRDVAVSSADCCVGIFPVRAAQIAAKFDPKKRFFTDYRERRS